MSQYVLKPRTLALNSIYNLIAQILPMLVGVVAIPFIIKGLGLERFGILTILWMIVGYFSLLDLGLGRGITKIVAENIGQREKSSPAVFTSLAIMGIVSALGTFVLYFLVPLAIPLLKVPPELLAESVLAFKMIILSLPFVVLAAGFRGVFEGEHRFFIVNVFQIFISILNYLAPLLILPFSQSLYDLSFVLLAMRILSFLVFFIVFMKFFKVTGITYLKTWSEVKKLLTFGGWITVANTIGPLLYYFDRYLLGMIVPIREVPFYTTPYEVVSRLWFIPSSLVRVLFPAFATSKSLAPQKINQLYELGTKFILGFMGLISICVAGFGKWGLEIWLGPEFAQNAFFILTALMVGIFINSLAWIPFTLLQTEERSDLVVKTYICELPFYVILFWYLTTNWGAQGASLAWVVRVLADSSLIFWLSSRVFPVRKSFLLKLFAYFIITIIFILISMGLANYRPLLSILNLGIFIIFFIFGVLSVEERRKINEIRKI